MNTKAVHTCLYREVTERAAHGLTDSIYAGVSQLIDRSLLVDSVRVLGFYNSTHLQDKDTVLILHASMLQAARLRQPPVQPGSSPPSFQTYL